MNNESISYKPLILMSVGVTVLWIIAATVVYFSFNDWATRGQVGDLFGTINALFSGLAFSGIVYTIHLQKHDLMMTRLELAENANSQEKSIRISALNSMIQTYGLILDPAYGMRNRTIGSHDLHEDKVKARLLKSLEKLEAEFNIQEN